MNIQKINAQANFMGIKYQLADGQYVNLSALDDKKYGQLKKQLADIDKASDNTPCDIYVADKNETGEKADKIYISNRDTLYKYYEFVTDRGANARVSDTDERDVIVNLKYNHNKKKDTNCSDYLILHRETVSDAEKTVKEYNDPKNLLAKIKVAYEIATQFVKRDI